MEGRAQYVRYLLGFWILAWRELDIHRLGLNPRATFLAASAPGQ